MSSSGKRRMLIAFIVLVLVNVIVLAVINVGFFGRGTINHASGPSDNVLSDFIFVAKQWPESAEAAEAFDKLFQAVGNVSIDDLTRTFNEIAPNHGEQWRRLGTLLIDRVRQEPDHPFVHCSAHFALATIVRAGGAKRQNEARRLYEDFLNEFDGNTDYRAQAIERSYRDRATRILNE